MNTSSVASASDAGDLVRVHWPLYSIYPASACCFYLWYWAAPAVPALVPRAFRKWHPFDQNSWMHHTASGVHSLFVVSTVVAVLSTDSGVSASGLQPHYNKWMYIAACTSLAFFTFALPWTLRMYFSLRARRPYTSVPLIVHHIVVVAALLVYLLTQYCPHHGALAILLLEFTNWFSVPMRLMNLLGMKGTCWAVNGVMFVAAYTACRICACTWLVLRMTIDFARFEPPHDAGWAMASVTLSAIYVLVFLSFFWFIQDILPATHIALEDLIGLDYHHRCCPKPLRSCAARVAHLANALISRIPYRRSRTISRITPGAAGSAPGQSDPPRIAA